MSPVVLFLNRMSSVPVLKKTHATHRIMGIGAADLVPAGKSAVIQNLVPRICESWCFRCPGSLNVTARPIGMDRVLAHSAMVTGRSLSVWENFIPYG
jgi:hypothetical protein